MRFLHSVRSQIVLVTLACVLPASLAAAVLIAFYYERERDKALADSMQTARALAMAVDQNLASTQATLLALSTSRAIASGDLQDFYVKAKAVLRYQIANNIVLIDAEGRQHLNTLRPFGEPLPANGNPPQLDAIFQTGRPVITDLFMGPVAHRALVAVGVPVMRDDRVLYTLAAGIWPERLSRILAQQHLPDGWVVGILDSSGTIVARTIDEARFVGKKASPALSEALVNSREGSLESSTLEGIRVYTAFSRSAISNWAVAVGVPTAQVSAQLWKSVGWLILVTVLLLLAGIAIAWRVGGEIVASFHALITPAAALGRRERLAIPSLRLIEAKALGGALAQAAFALEASEASLRRLGDNLTNGAVFRTVVAADGTRRFDHMSKGIKQLTGIAPEEILAHAEVLYARIHPEDRRTLVAAQDYSLGTGNPIELELRVAHVDGTQRWLDLHSAAERRSDGATVWEGVVVDVTERKRAHAVQREAEERLRLMVEGVKDYALFGLDLEGNVDSWNAGAQRLLGYSAAEILGRHFSCLHIAEEMESGETRRELVVAAAQGRHEAEGWRVRKDGTRFMADAVVAALRDSNGVLRGFVKVLRDVSARRKAQREREDLLDQLRALNGELEARVAERTGELEVTLREREVLLKEIHHRVKNNLQVVSSLISMQLRHVPDGEAAKTLEECKARVHTMALIHEQLYRSRDFTSISFSQYFNDVARNVFQATGVSSKSISLELAIQEVSLGMEKAIPCGLILNELMSNALKHGFPHGRQGRVRITLESPDGDNLRLAVSDDGVGLPPGLEVDKCSSLGLQLVSVLTGQLRGKLQIHEAAGGGTTFELVFPLETAKPRASSQPLQVRAASATSATV